jgi:hypothetical protein
MDDAADAASSLLRFDFGLRGCSRQGECQQFYLISARIGNHSLILNDANRRCQGNHDVNTGEKWVNPPPPPNPRHLPLWV